MSTPTLHEQPHGPMADSPAARLLPSKMSHRQELRVCASSSVPLSGPALWMNFSVKAVKPVTGTPRSQEMPTWDKGPGSQFHAARPENL